MFHGKQCPPGKRLKGKTAISLLYSYRITDQTSSKPFLTSNCKTEDATYKHVQGRSFLKEEGVRVNGTPETRF